MPNYCEVHGTTLIRPRYTLGTLMEDNPFTNYEPLVDIAAEYPATQRAIETGNTLEPITYAAEPARPNGMVVTLNDAPTLLDGVWTWGWTVSPMTPEQVAARKTVRKNDVTALRDQKVDAGFMFEGVLYQSRPQDRENVSGVHQRAKDWLDGGGDPTTLRWANPNVDFVFIAADNSMHPMTAPTAKALGVALYDFKSACIFHAYELKMTIDAATTGAEVDAIDITVGWPT